MRKFYLSNKLWFDRLSIVLGLILFVWVLVLAMEYIAPFLFAYVISLILSPLVWLLHRKFKIHRGVSAAVLILVVLTLILGLATLIINRIITEMMLFSQDIPYYIAGVESFFENTLGWLESFLGLSLDASFEAMINQILAMAADLATSGIGAGTFDIFTAIPGAVLRIIITIISAFFFIRDKDLIKGSIANLMPEFIIEKVTIIKRGILDALYGYFKGQLIIMCVVSVIITAGLLILGNPYALFIGIGIALFDLIPVLGAGGILLPWAIYMFLSGNIRFGIGLLVISVVVFLNRQILEPRIVAGQMGIHPIALLLSIYLGLQILGFVGFLAGPMIAIAVKTVFNASLED